MNTGHSAGFPASLSSPSAPSWLQVECECPSEVENKTEEDRVPYPRPHTCRCQHEDWNVGFTDPTNHGNESLAVVVIINTRGLASAESGMLTPTSSPHLTAPFLGQSLLVPKPHPLLCHQSPLCFPHSDTALWPVDFICRGPVRTGLPECACTSFPSTVPIT